jgi:hypothetical protein
LCVHFIGHPTTRLAEGSFSFGDTFFSPWFQINLFWELTVVVDFDALQGLVVEVKSLEIEDYRRRKLLDVGAALDIYQSVVVLFTLVLVVTFEDVWLDVEIKRFLQALLVFNVECKGEERLLFQANIRVVSL